MQKKNTLIQTKLSAMESKLFTTTMKTRIDCLWTKERNKEEKKNYSKPIKSI